MHCACVCVLVVAASLWDSLKVSSKHLWEQSYNNKTVSTLCMCVCVGE